MAEIYLLSIDRLLAERISRAFEGRAKFRLLQQLDGDDLTGPGVIVLDRAAIPQNRSVAAAVADTVAQAEGLPVVLACDVDDVGEVLAAVRAGAIDVLARDAADDEIADVLGRRLNSALVGQARLGNLKLVLGAGVESAAILATDVALCFANEGRTTILIDCTIPKSACETYLDLKVTYGVASAVADMSRLDSALLGNAVVRHEPSGLMLLTLDGGSGSEPTGLSAGDIVALVKLLQACCADIVFCAGNLRNAELLASLAAMAESIELVSTQSIIELEALRRLADHIGLTPDDRARSRLLLWDHQPAVLLDGRRMADVLAVRNALGVGFDAAALRNALNLGRPLYQYPDDDFGYRQIVKTIAGVKGEVTQLPVAAKALGKIARIWK